MVVFFNECKKMVTSQLEAKNVASSGHSNYLEAVPQDSYKKMRLNWSGVTVAWQSRGAV
jgi:hypothetical protein